MNGHRYTVRIQKQVEKEILSLPKTIMCPNGDSRLGQYPAPAWLRQS